MSKYLSDKMWQARGRLLTAKAKMKDQMLKLIREEDGDTNFVAIIVIIVIIIAIAAIFRDKLAQAMNTVFGKLTTFMNEKPKLE